MSRPLALLDLFSGIGGFSLGLERAGFRTIAFCESDPFCRRVLARHWPEVPCYDDVRTLTADRLRADGITVDAICGGWPCQDVSVAGNRTGIHNGQRSSLVWEILRLASELRPTCILLENVPGLLSGATVAVEHSVHCLCGWSCRWRGMPWTDGEDACRVRSPQFLVPSFDRNGRQGECDSDIVPLSAWWRPSDQNIGQSSASGEDGLECAHQAGPSAAASHASAHARQERTMPTRDTGLPAYDQEAGEFRARPISHQGIDARVESDRSEDTAQEWMVCTNCGRRMGDPTSRLVQSSWFGDILRAFSSLRYDVWWDCIPASAVRAPHRRDRVWIVAYAAKLLSNGCEHNGRSDCESREQISKLGNGSCIADVANAIGKRCEATTYTVEQWKDLERSASVSAQFASRRRAFARGESTDEPVPD
jgi:site-specific DNA-cytosine methylase